MHGGQVRASTYQVTDTCCGTCWHPWHHWRWNNPRGWATDKRYSAVFSPPWGGVWRSLSWLQQVKREQDSHYHLSCGTLMLSVVPFISQSWGWVAGSSRESDIKCVTAACAPPPTSSASTVQKKQKQRLISCTSARWLCTCQDSHQLDGLYNGTN